MSVLLTWLWSSTYIGPKRSHLDFVAFSLEFLAANLDFVARRFGFRRAGLETSSPPMEALPGASPGEPRLEKIAQLRPRARSGAGVVGERHSHDSPAGAEFGIVEAMGRAGIDDKLDGAGRLPLRQLGAIGGRGHSVLGADEDERGDVELGVRLVGAWGIEGRRRPERRRARGPGGSRDLERRVGALGEADRRDAPGVDHGLASEK